MTIVVTDHCCQSRLYISFPCWLLLARPDRIAYRLAGGDQNARHHPDARFGQIDVLAALRENIRCALVLPSAELANRSHKRLDLIDRSRPRRQVGFRVESRSIDIRMTQQLLDFQEIFPTFQKC